MNKQALFGFGGKQKVKTPDRIIKVKPTFDKSLHPKTIELLNEQLGLDYRPTGIPLHISKTQRLSDLGADELDCVELLMAIEEEPGYKNIKHKLSTMPVDADKQPVSLYDDYFRKTHGIKKAMYKQAFVRGFVKAALANNVDLLTAIKLADMGLPYTNQAQNIKPMPMQTLMPSQPAPPLTAPAMTNQMPDAMSNMNFNIPATSSLGAQLQQHPQSTPSLGTGRSIAGIRG